MWIAVVSLLVAAHETAAECLPGVQTFIDESNGVVDEAGFVEVAMAVQVRARTTARAHRPVSIWHGTTAGLQLINCINTLQYVYSIL